MSQLKKLAVLLLVLLFPITATGQDLDWELMGPAMGNLTCLHADETGTALFAGTYEGFWYYTFDTGVWTQREDVGWIGRTVWSITSHAEDPATVVTGRVNAFFKGYLEWSDDWGATGDPAYMSNGGSVKDVKGIPETPDNLIACTWSDIAPGELLRSTDSGASWTMVATPIHYAMTEISVDRSQPDTIYVSGSSLMTKSTDGGDSWATSNNGLPGTLGVYCVSCSPLDSQLLLCSNDNGIYRSTDAGEFWNFVTTPLGTTVIQHFAFSPTQPGLVAAVTFSPYRLILSEDGGLNWTDASGSLAIYSLTDTVFSPDGTTLYASTVGNGVWAAAMGGGTVSCEYACTPDSGTLPFTFQHQLTLQNLCENQPRRMAARIDVTLGNGTFYGNWRSGHINIAPLGQYDTQWPSTLPAWGRVVGDNVFLLTTEDVTPAPYNQPPYPASGDTATASCTVTGLLP